MQPATSAAQTTPSAGEDANDVKVLFLAGLGRSGSTIVANVLGQHSNAVSIGELVHLWHRGLADNELCGCAKPLRDCEFWTRVGEVAFGGWDHLDLDEVIDLQRRVDRNRFVPLMVVPQLHPSRARAQARYTSILLDIYRAIREVSGAEVIVDSTKHVSYAYLLSQIEGIDVRVAHLVRESQGVAYSWAKTVARPEVTAGHDEMPRYSPARTSSKWLSYNLMLHGLRTVRTPRQLVRYEDVMSDPRGQVASLMEFAGLTPLELDHIGDGWVELGPTHTVAGNPSRFKHGRVDLRLDRAWVDEMEPRDKRIVGALTWPLSTAYGYRRQEQR
ncbi:MAG: sulfotransferase [Acidimicrobiales bacterium]